MENFEVSSYTDQLQSYAIYLISTLSSMGKTYEEVANHCGLSRQTLSKRKSDPSKVTIKELQSLERMLQQVKDEL